MGLRHQWNTGRMYQTDGQKIIAEVRDGYVYFRDTSRMIFGRFEVPNPHIIDEFLLKDVTMNAYDFNQYHHVLYSEVKDLVWED